VKSQQSLKLGILDYVFMFFFSNATSKNRKSHVSGFSKKRKNRILEL